MSPTEVQVRGEQLSLDLTEVPVRALPIPPAVCLLGLTEVQRIRAAMPQQDLTEVR